MILRRQLPRTAQFRSCTTAATNFLRGKVLEDSRLDLAKVRVGQMLEIPYEMTVDAGWRDQWQSQFYQQDRLYTSQSFAKTVGFEQTPMPNCLVLFLALSMSHVDQTRDVFDLRIKNAVYEKPVFPLDTLKRRFVIQDVRESSNGKNVVVDVLCKVFNQHGQRCYSLVKTMMFTKSSLGDNIATMPLDWTPPESSFANSIISRTKRSRRNENTVTRPASFYKLKPGQLILHSFQRPVGFSAMNISTQFRMTHPRLFNTTRFKPKQDIIVATPLILASAHASAGHELFETYYESCDNALFPNACGPEDNLGAMTYVKSVNDAPNDLEELKCITIGIKNVDVTRALDGVDVPLDLFVGERSLKHGIIPREIEKICDDHIPILSDKIVVHSERTLLREKPYQVYDEEYFLL